MAVINNSSSWTIVAGTSGNDTITNRSQPVTIDAGDGDDFITNNTYYVSINAGKGNDTIDDTGGSVTVLGGAGNDSIRIKEHLMRVYGEDGDDTINNLKSGAYSKIFGDAGNDYISNSGDHVTLEGGDGNDSLINEASLTAVRGGDGADYIINSGDSVTIDGGAAGDFISVSGRNTTIYGGDGDDTIDGTSWRPLLAGGGKGNDLIKILEYNDTIQYAEGDGNDTIIGFTEKLMPYYDYPNVLQITAGSVSSVLSIGSDAILKIGDGSIRLTNSANRTIKIVDAEGNAFDTVIGSAIPVEGSLTNSANDVMIRLDGNDVVTLKGARQVIDVGDGNNTIVGYEEDDTIRVDFWQRSLYRPNAADRTVSVSGSDVIVGDEDHTFVIKGAAKKKITLIDTEEKTLYVPPAGSTVAADSAINYVINLTDNVRVDVGTQNATIDNFGDKVTVKADGGTANIQSAGSNVSVKTGAGNDLISIDDQEGGGISNVTIDAGEGNNNVGISAAKWSESDSVENGENFSVKTGAGIDTITLYNVDKAKVNAGGGNDTINIAYSGRSTIDAGDGDNNIEIAQYGCETTDFNVRSGAGVDSILGHGVIGVSVDAGGGNDTIKVMEESQRFTLNGGAGDDTIILDDNLYDGKVNALILGGAGNDSIYNDGGDSLTLDGGDGNDTVYNDRGSNVTLLGGAGDDYLYSYGENNVLFGGDGNDTLDSYSSTLNGGKGNDSIGNVSFYQYANGDGDDTISAVYNDWILNLTSGSVSTVTAEGEGFKIKIGTGSILVSKFEEYNYNYRLPLVVMDSKNNFSAWYRNAGGSFASLGAGASGQIGDFIYNFGSKTTVTADDVEIISNYGSNVKINATIPSYAKEPAYIGNYGSNVTIDTAGEDGDKYFEIFNQLGSNVLINANGNVFNGGASATINGSSNVINNGDKVLINNTTAGGDDAGVFVENSGSNVTINAIDLGTVNEEDYDYTHIINRGDKVFINATLSNKNEDGYSAIDNSGENVTIRSSALDNFIGNSARNVTIDAAAGNDSIYNKSASVSINAGDGNDSIRNNADGFDVTILAGAGNDTIRNSANGGAFIDAGAGNDFIRDAGYGSTINAGAGDDILSLDGGSVIRYKTGDGNDTVYDNYYEGDTLLLDSAYSTVLGKEVRKDDYNEDAYDVIVKVGSGSITFVAASNQTLNIAGGTLTGGGGGGSTPGGDDTVDSGITFDPKKATAITVIDYTGTVDANDYSDKVTTIDASKSANDGLVLKANDKKGTAITAGSGASTLIGGEKDDKLYGGDGANVFAYAVGGGKDAVYKYDAAKDVVSLDGATFDKMSFVDKNNVVTIKFDGSAGSQLTVNKSNTEGVITFDIGGETFTYGELPTGVTFDDKSKRTALKVDATAADGVVVDAGNIVSTAKTIDGAAAGGAVHLIGNDVANIIKAGDKGSTLYGGRSTKAVADKMFGGAGVDVFKYALGDGADVIYSLDGGKGDYVLLDGVTELKDDAMKWSGNKLVVTIGGQKLTLDDPRGEVRFVDGEGNLLNKTGVNFPSGVGYNAKKTAVTIGSAASNVAPIDLSDTRYLSTVKEINASAYGGAIELSGNGQSNVIYAGKGGSTLYGGLGADKLYGGAGVDVFKYAAGDGADVIYSLDGGKGDYVVLDGVTELKKDAMNWSGNKLVVTIGNQKLTLDDPRGEVRFVDGEGALLNKTGVNFPSGVGYNAKKTAVTIGSAAVDLAPIDLTDGYTTTVKEINASAYGGAIELRGNNQANVIYAGKGGSTLYGGVGDAKKPSADKLYGGDGADVFKYAAGDGADIIYKFDGGKGDKVLLEGVDKLDSSAFKVSATKVDVTIGKGKLSFDNPNGEINFVNADGDTLYSMGINFPTGIGYDKKKAAVTIDGTAADVAPIDLSSPKYLSTVKEINASAYGGALELTGNANANVIRAGKGGATLNGGYDAAKKKVTADKLYGSSATTVSDVFVWDAVWGGGDQIFNYSAAAGDIISITGVDDKFSIDNSDFKISGNKVVMSVGTGKLTVNDLVDSKTVKVAYGDKTFGFATLPAGVGYDSKSGNKLMTIGGAFEGTFDVTTQDYLGTVATLNASTNENAIELIGNKKTKAIVGGKGTTTVIGAASVADNFYAGTGSDTFVYASGGGKDVIYNFDGSADVIRLSDTTVEATDFTEKGNDITLTIGKGSITLKNAPRGSITVEQDGGAVTYKTLPTGVTYKYNASKKSGTATLDKDFSGTLSATDLGLPVSEINATAVKVLKIELGGDLTAGKVSGSNVELTTADGTVTIKGIVGKELTVTNGGVDQKYKFEKTTKTLADALIDSGSAADLPSEDYWFMQSTDSIDEIGELIGVGTTTDETAIGLSDQLPKTLIPTARPLFFARNKK